MAVTEPISAWSPLKQTRAPTLNFLDCLFVILLSYSQFRPADKAALAICEMRCRAPYPEALAEILAEGDNCLISSLGRSGQEHPDCLIFTIVPAPDAANHAVARGLCGAAIPERLLCIAA